MPRRSETVREVLDSFQRLIPDLVFYNDWVAREMGITLVDSQTLHVIMLAGGTLTPSEVSARTGQPSSTTTRVLDRLEQAGYVERQPDPADRRRTRVVADLARLEAGNEKYYGHLVGHMNQVASTFSEPELRVIARFLSLVGEAQPETPG